MNEPQLLPMYSSGPLSEGYCHELIDESSDGSSGKNDPFDDSSMSSREYLPALLILRIFFSRLIRSNEFLLLF